jgi:hypothetical protein
MHSQELFSKKPANTGDFCRCHSGEREFAEERLAEGKVLETNPLCLQVIDFVEVRITLLSNPMRASK